MKTTGVSSCRERLGFFLGFWRVGVMCFGGFFGEGVFRFWEVTPVIL
ncbi:hypothetical protein HanOQP8_Chr11g0386641 [Helianthus annuus]|nr:hypothetical protein HanOQP8_Chr11g0386641 [Helianthus annuus]